MTVQRASVGGWRPWVERARAAIDWVGEALFPENVVAGLVGDPVVVGVPRLDAWSRSWLPTLALAKAQAKPAGGGAKGSDPDPDDADDESEEDDGDGDEGLDGATKKRIEARGKEYANRALSQLKEKLQKAGILPKGKKIEDLAAIVKEERDAREKLHDELEELKATRGGKPKGGGEEGDDDSEEEGDDPKPKKVKDGDAIPLTQHKKLLDARIAREREKASKTAAEKDQRILELEELMQVHVVGSAFKATASDLDLDPELTPAVLLSRRGKVKTVFPYVVKPHPTEPGEVILYDEDGETEAGKTLREAMAELKADPAFEGLVRSKVVPGSGGDGGARPGAKGGGDKKTREKRELRGPERIAAAVPKRFGGAA